MRALFSFLLLTLSAAAPPERWADYANARFAYKICYPADRLRPMPEADNGDGRRFRGTAGVELAVWGSNNSMDQTLKAVRQAERAVYRQIGFTISYDRMGADWFVLSGTKGGQILYRKTILAHDHFLTMEIHYPKADAAKWNPVVDRVSRCLRDLNGKEA